MLGDPNRGYLLEILLNKLLLLQSQNRLDLQIITLSATLPNINEIVSYTHSQFFIATQRPNKLTEHIIVRHLPFLSRRSETRSITPTGTPPTHYPTSSPFPPHFNIALASPSSCSTFPLKTNKPFFSFQQNPPPSPPPKKSFPVSPILFPAVPPLFFVFDFPRESHSRIFPSLTRHLFSPKRSKKASVSTMPD